MKKIVFLLLLITTPAMACSKLVGEYEYCSYIKFSGTANVQNYRISSEMVDGMEALRIAWSYKIGGRYGGSWDETEQTYITDGKVRNYEDQSYSAKCTRRGVEITTYFNGNSSVNLYKKDGSSLIIGEDEFSIQCN